MMWIVVLLLIGNVAVSAETVELEIGCIGLPSQPQAANADDDVLLSDGWSGAVFLSGNADPMANPIGTFQLSNDPPLVNRGVFLEAIDWSARPQAADRIVFRIWDSSEPRRANGYWESPEYEILSGRQQVIFASHELTFHRQDRVPASSAGSDLMPRAAGMLTAYPNPFNATATLSFELDRVEHVRLTLYDVQGREVVDLLEANLSEGQHRVSLDGSRLASGTYFAGLQRSGVRYSLQRITLIR